VGLCPAAGRAGSGLAVVWLGDRVRARPVAVATGPQQPIAGWRRTRSPSYRRPLQRFPASAPTAGGHARPGWGIPRRPSPTGCSWPHTNGSSRLL